MLDISVDTDPVRAQRPGARVRLVRVADLLVRVAGGVLALAGGALAGMLALVLVPLRLDTGGWVVRIPVAVLLAVAGNWLLLWFARRATGVRWSVLVPAAGWFAVMLPAVGGTSGWQLLVPNDWVGMLTLFAGTVVLTIGSVVTLVAPAPYRERS